MNDNWIENQIDAPALSEPLPDAAITAAVDALHKRYSLVADAYNDARLAADVTVALKAAAPALRAQGAATERARIREHLRGVVGANAPRGNDLVLGALLDAIRELDTQPQEGTTP